MITYESAEKASFYILLFLVVFLGLKQLRTWNPIPIQFSIKPYSWIISFLTFIFIFLLLQKTGGISNSIENPGQNNGGQTILILGVAAGRIPFLYQFILKKIRIFDSLLYILILLVILFNSRFIAITLLVELTILYSLFYKKIQLQNIIYLGVISIFIIFGYGLYRDFSYRFEAKTFATFINYLKEVDFNIALEWFYYYNIEGFSGFSNVIRVINQGASLDYGISQLNAIFSILPNSLKTSDSLIFKELIFIINDSFPSKGSVVPSPMEIFYGNFGFLGVILYALVFSATINYIQKKIYSEKSMYIVFWVCLLSFCLSGFRGNIIGILIFFGIISFGFFWIYTSLIKLK